MPGWDGLGRVRKVSLMGQHLIPSRLRSAWLGEKSPDFVHDTRQMIEGRVACAVSGEWWESGRRTGRPAEFMWSGEG